MRIVSKITWMMVIKSRADVFTFHVPKNLQKFWERNSLLNMTKVNRDLVVVVDGPEGSGKSTWAIQQFHNLEPTAFETPEKFVSRIVFSPEEFFEKVREVKNGVIIFDEAFRGFSSRAALSKVNRKLVQALMEMRQRNNIVFIVLPSVFLLDIYPAMLRSNFLFNIYFQKNSKRRAWRGYNKQAKNAVYQIGIKKGWTYPFGTPFKGYFYSKFPGGEEYRAAYEKKKSEALMKMDLHDNKKEIESKEKAMTDIMIKFANENNFSSRDLAKYFTAHGKDITKTTILNRIKAA